MIEPITNIYWLLPAPLVAFSIVYAGTRHEDWTLIAWRSAYWMVYLLGFLGGAFVVIAGVEGLKESFWVIAVAFGLWWLAGWLRSFGTKAAPLEAPAKVSESPSPNGRSPTV